MAHEWFRGDGSTTTFDIKFYFLSKDDLKFLIERSTGHLETITPAQVTGDGDQNGGSFTVSVAPTVSERIGVFRNLSLGQPTDIEAQEDIPPAAIQVALDRLAMINIQQQNLIDRTVQASPADPAIALTLPVASLRANKGLFFDGNGDPVARSASELSIMAADIDFATQADAEAGVDTAKVMTPLATAQAITALSVPGVPTGTIIMHARPGGVPEGYLYCNGAAVSRSTYFDLFASIETNWGVGDGSTTFNLPDFRGEFIRGWDNGRGVDPNRVFGSAQGDEFRAHDHITAGGTWDGSSAANSAFRTAGSGESVNRNLVREEGGSETRPRNIAVNFYIKY